MENITHQIRKTFSNYFKKQGHTLVPASSLVPINDSTLFFTNSGMVQFKNYFTGAEKPPFPCASTIQKSVRADGKHNDLDNVGYTVRHHTFFEMLGNFSFGDYFKEKAIFYAWEMLTKEMQFDKNRLLVTIYHTDDEAYALWKKIANLPDEKIIRISTKDNFWQMGPIGPCGPCSEIFYDHGEKYAGGPPGSPDEDGDRFIEIWNLVFDQYEDLPDGSRIEIPRKSIDTGAGLERWSAILHGTNDNFKIDIFDTLIKQIADLTSVEINGEAKHSLRVIADHLRSSSFLLSAGVFPSNEGRGYALRRIMRRAMRHAHLIGSKEPLMYKLLPTLISTMGEAYPELIENKELITEGLKQEEERFRQTLDMGLKLLETETASLNKGDILSGSTAFKLYDTFGFPLDLTQDALRNKGISINLEEFNQEMERQKALARKSWSGSGEALDEKIWFKFMEDFPKTEFLGWDKNSLEAQIQILIKNNASVSSVKGGDTVAIITNQTPFYGEKGGQIGDTGLLITKESTVQITQTLCKAGGHFIVHFGIVQKGTLKAGETCQLFIDEKRRLNIRAHHSCTHLLQSALQKVLGKAVHQKGSFVADTRLRFDFVYPKALTKKEIEQVETVVNQMILKNLPTQTEILDIEEAKSRGAMALFDEKYGKDVRVVSMGVGKEALSCELCGGTHVSRTGDIGFFKILSEAAISAGIRRIEGIVGIPAYEYISTQSDSINTLLNLIKAPNLEEGLLKIQTLFEEKKKLEKQLVDLKQKLLTGSSAEIKPELINNIPFFTKTLEECSPKELKSFIDQYKKQIQHGIIVLFSSSSNKVSLVIGITPDLTSQFDAVTLVKSVIETLGGSGGGGRADLAQAGGTNPQNIPKAIQILKDLIN